MSRLIVDADNIINGRITEGSYAENEEITSLVIPEGVTDIGEVAFYGCSNLREVVLPASLEYVREEAFGETALEKLIFPKSLKSIEEKAFYSCARLRSVEVPGRDTVIGSDAFGCCDELIEGYIACGYPGDIKPHEELQYTLLWCSCPGRHTEETARRAESFIRANQDLIMEWIIRQNNIPAMSGIAGRDLLKGDRDRYIMQSGLEGRSEITALLMSMRRYVDEGEYEL